MQTALLELSFFDGRKTRWNREGLLIDAPAETISLRGY